MMFALLSFLTKVITNPNYDKRSWLFVKDVSVKMTCFKEVRSSYTKCKLWVRWLICHKIRLLNAFASFFWIDYLGCKQEIESDFWLEDNCNIYCVGMLGKVLIHWNYCFSNFLSWACQIYGFKGNKMKIFALTFLHKVYYIRLSYDGNAITLNGFIAKFFLFFR